ncbi:MAG: hypothetical protein HC822_06790 [Oscillochloris sp.]|nr:hypothetical protein [Oscillochloris sp.]
MEIRIDENGKFFTSHIKKDPHRAVIHTAYNLVIGTIHIHPERRVKDELNHDAERFLAITDAVVYTIDGSMLLYTSEFILLAYAQIVAVVPLDALKTTGDILWANDLLKEAS